MTALEPWCILPSASSLITHLHPPRLLHIPPHTLIYVPFYFTITQYKYCHINLYSNIWLTMPPWLSLCQFLPCNPQHMEEKSDDINGQQNDHSHASVFLKVRMYPFFSMHKGPAEYFNKGGYMESTRPRCCAFISIIYFAPWAPLLPQWPILFCFVGAVLPTMTEKASWIWRIKS